MSIQAWNTLGVGEQVVIRICICKMHAVSWIRKALTSGLRWCLQNHFNPGDPNFLCSELVRRKTLTQSSHSCTQSGRGIHWKVTNVITAPVWSGLDKCSSEFLWGGGFRAAVTHIYRTPSDNVLLGSPRHKPHVIWIHLRLLISTLRPNFTSFLCLC